MFKILCSHFGLHWRAGACKRGGKGSRDGEQVGVQGRVYGKAGQCCLSAARTPSPQLRGPAWPARWQRLSAAQPADARKPGELAAPLGAAPWSNPLAQEPSHLRHLAAHPRPLDSPRPLPSPPPPPPRPQRLGAGARGHPDRAPCCQQGPVCPAWARLQAGRGQRNVARRAGFWTGGRMCGSGAWRRSARLRRRAVARAGGSWRLRSRQWRLARHCGAVPARHLPPSLSAQRARPQCSCPLPRLLAAAACAPARCACGPALPPLPQGCLGAGLLTKGELLLPLPAARASQPSLPCCRAACSPKMRCVSSSSPGRLGVSSPMSTLSSHLEGNVAMGRHVHASASACATFHQLPRASDS